MLENKGKVQIIGSAKRLVQALVGRDADIIFNESFS